MNFRAKLFLITVMPLIAIALIIGGVISFQASRLIEAEIHAIEQRLLETKRQELSNYTELALTSIKRIYEEEPGGRASAQAEVKRILNDMTFGEDGYFFVYDEKGKNLVHPKQAYLVDQDLWDMQDPAGNYIIRNLISQAQAGGGFHHYIWNKPSTRQVTKKLGYAVMLDKWGWMLGSGLYTDDIDQEINAIKKDISSNVRQTSLVIFLITLVAVQVVAGIVGVFRFSQQKFADQKLKKLTKRIVDIQEEERKRVSRELHDSISQLLVSVRYGLDLIQVKTAQTPSTQQSLAKCLSILDDAISEVRRISKDLRPSLLDDMGLAAALKSLGSDFSGQTGISVDLKAERFYARLPDAVKTALFRVVQEALTNVAKHANANHVTIRLTSSENELKLHIKDDGAGLPHPLPRTKGLGIQNMQERVDAHGGVFSIGPSRDGGTEIEVKMPIQRAQGAAV